MDFLAVTESHLNAEIDDREISINGYKIIRKDRPNGSPWGGCALYYKENLEVHVIHKYMSDDIEAIWAELLLNSQRLLIGCLYRPPDNSSFLDKLDEILGKAQTTRKNIVIVGDLNADVSYANSTTTSNPLGKKLLTILNTHGCKNVISNPTRVTKSTKSTIDLAIVNNPPKVSNSGVLDLSIADHKMIFVTYKMKTKSPGFSIKRVRNYRSLDKKSLRKDLQDIPWWVTSLFDDIDDVTHAWELLFKDVLDTHLPTRTAKIRKESLPWVTGEIRKEMNKRYKLLRKCDSTSNTSAIWEEYKRTRNKVTRMLREAESTFWLNQFKKAKNAKDFWNTVTEVMNLHHKKHKQTGPLQQSSSELITSNTEKAELINDFFVNIGKNLADKFDPHEHEDQTTDLSDLYNRVTPTISDLSSCELRIAYDLNKLKPRKAAGPDEIQAKDLVIAGNSAIDGLNTIFCKSLKSSRFPSKWKLARVAAIFKKGNPLDPANYRPLSMLSLPGKLLESQFCRVLDEHLQTHNLYSNNQRGFRKGRSTETLLISMTERWRAALDDNKIVGAIFIDFRKAFDTISHELLPFKLQAVGIMGDSYNWILDYLKDRSQFTIINGSSSSTKPINFGVPQGSLLGPRLYSIYVNDLPDAVTEGEVEMYADDTTAYCIGDNFDTVTQRLNLIFKQIHRWSKRNRLSIHNGKSEAMLLSTKPLIGPLQELRYEDNRIDFVNSTCCLGVEIDNKLSWSPHIDKLCKGYRKKLGALRRMPRLPPKVLEEIYFKTVVPGVTYCIPVWGGCTAPLLTKLEEIHTKAARLIHDLPRDRDYTNILQKVNWLPLSYMYKKAILKHVHQAFYQAGPAQITELFSVKPETYNSRRSKQLVLGRPKMEIGRLSIRHRGAMIWNSIPSSVKDYNNVTSFKNNLKQFSKFINNFTFEKESSAIINKLDHFYYY